jgi:hypothetical protein
MNRKTSNSSSSPLHKLKLENLMSVKGCYVSLFIIVQNERDGPALAGGISGNRKVFANVCILERLPTQPPTYLRAKTICAGSVVTVAICTCDVSLSTCLERTIESFDIERKSFRLAIVV